MIKYSFVDFFFLVFTLPGGICSPWGGGGGGGGWGICDIGSATKQIYQIPGGWPGLVGGVVTAEID